METGLACFGACRGFAMVDPIPAGLVNLPPATTFPAWPQRKPALRGTVPANSVTGSTRASVRLIRVGVDPARVEKDQAVGIDLGQLGAPCRSLPGEVGPVLFGR